MVIPNKSKYISMLNAAKEGLYGYPAINVSSSSMLNGAIAGFVNAKSDGIIQISTSGGKFLSGKSINNMSEGAIALAKYAHSLIKNLDVNIALHTDHCNKEKIDTFLLPIIKESKAYINTYKTPLFNSYMWDGSALPLKENIDIANSLRDKIKEVDALMEIEIGVVGGEEDGIKNKINDKLYSTIEDALYLVNSFGYDNNSRNFYLLAATFGNVHGVYKPGNVKLKPSILNDIQNCIGKKYGIDKPFHLVFHGGSGSSIENIREAISYGVVKMNIDTDTQYAFTRPIVDHILKKYDEVLKIDGEVGKKSSYDPRTYLGYSEDSMAYRVEEACKILGSANKSIK